MRLPISKPSSMFSLHNFSILLRHAQRHPKLLRQQKHVHFLLRVKRPRHHGNPIKEFQNRMTRWRSSISPRSLLALVSTGTRSSVRSRVRMVCTIAIPTMPTPIMQILLWRLVEEGGVMLLTHLGFQYEQRKRE